MSPLASLLKKPSFLTDSKVKEFLALAKKQVSTVKYASSSRYVPDGSEKITIDGKDYPVKRVSFYRWCDSSGNAQMNINFSQEDENSHSNQMSEMQINLGDQGSSIGFRQKLINAGSSGSKITNANINVYDSTHGLIMNGEADVILIWKDNAINTFTVSSLPVNIEVRDGSGQVVKTVPVTFGNLTVQWRFTEY